MQKTEVDDDTRWLTDPAETIAAIYDVDVGATDPNDPWVRVSRRICPREGQYYGPAMLSLNGAMRWHPASRASIRGIDKVHFKSIDDLPAWLQGRIAVLNIAEPDEWVRGLGKRWSTAEQAKAGMWAHQTFNCARYYTIELNCKGLPR